MKYSCNLINWSADNVKLVPLPLSWPFLRVIRLLVLSFKGLLRLGPKLLQMEKMVSASTKMCDLACLGGVFGLFGSQPPFLIHLQGVSKAMQSYYPHIMMPDIFKKMAYFHKFFRSCTESGRYIRLISSGPFGTPRPC